MKTLNEAKRIKDLWKENSAEAIALQIQRMQFLCLLCYVWMKGNERGVEGWENIALVCPHLYVKASICFLFLEWPRENKKKNGNGFSS